MAFDRAQARHTQTFVLGNILLQELKTSASRTDTNAALRQFSSHSQIDIGDSTLVDAFAFAGVLQV